MTTPTSLEFLAPEGVDACTVDGVCAPAETPAASGERRADAPSRVAAGRADDAAPGFAELGVPARLVTALASVDRTTPFPIQAATLPSTLAGRDVLGRGKTGSGKTLAFSIPTVARLTGHRSKPGRPSALVLAPTRELATQIAKTLQPLADAAKLRVTTVFGGVSQRPQEAAFRAGVDIVVACPGRLDDLMKQGIVNLSDIEITVLDEADHMADLGFLPVVTRIMNATPGNGQRLLFSATLDNGVDKLVKRFLDNPVRHSVDEASSPVAAMTHHVFEASDATAKMALVRTLASGRSRRLLFTRTKHQAKKLAKQLTAAGIPAVDLHGNLSQNARDRNLAEFSSGEVRVLVATDVAARGVHVDEIELVVHVDPPAEHKAYLHRSGRTARAGSAGDVVTIMLPEQRRDTQQLLRQAKISATPQKVSATSDAVLTLVGEIAEHVAPRPGGPGAGNRVEQRGGGTSQGANAQRKRAARGGSGAGSSAGGRGSGARADGGRSEGSRSGGARGSGARTESASAYGESTGASRSGSSRRRGGRGRGGQGGEAGRAPGGRPAQGSGSQGGSAQGSSSQGGQPRSQRATGGQSAPSQASADRNRRRRASWTPDA